VGEGHRSVSTYEVEEQLVREVVEVVRHRVYVIQRHHTHVLALRLLPGLRLLGLACCHVRLARYQSSDPGGKEALA
jgi:hypothetical protein